MLVEPIGTWIMYMLWQAKREARDRRGVDVPTNGPRSARFARVA